MNENPILVVAAHPDDEVLGCGGYMARMAAQGRPIHVLILADSVAMTQSYMGYQLQNALETAFHRRGLPHAVSTVVTRVRVNPDDPRFLRPTKPVGPFYTEEEAALLQKQGKNMKEDAGRALPETRASPETRALP